MGGIGVRYANAPATFEGNPPEAAGLDALGEGAAEGGGAAAVGVPHAVQKAAAGSIADPHFVQLAMS